MAIILPVLLMLLLSIWQFGVVYDKWQNLNGAAREGARAAIVAPQGQELRGSQVGRQRRRRRPTHAQQLLAHLHQPGRIARLQGDRLLHLRHQHPRSRRQVRRSLPRRDHAGRVATPAPTRPTHEARKESHPRDADLQQEHHHQHRPGGRRRGRAARLHRTRPRQRQRRHQRDQGDRGHARGCRSAPAIDQAQSKGYLSYQTVRQSDLADGAITNFAAISGQVVTAGAVHRRPADREPCRRAQVADSGLPRDRQLPRRPGAVQPQLRPAVRPAGGRPRGRDDQLPQGRHDHHLPLGAQRAGAAGRPARQRRAVQQRRCRDR